jgi:hypothetical protein
MYCLLKLKTDCDLSRDRNIIIIRFDGKKHVIFTINEPI